MQPLCYYCFTKVMTLTTHAIVGAAAASLVPHYPVAGFVLGFASHFAIDSIPHFDEGSLLHSTQKDNRRPFARSIHYGKELLYDFSLVGFDALLGFLLSVAILWGLFHIPLYIVLLGAFAALLPDGLQFIYFVAKPKFMDPLQRFHAGIQKQYPDVRLLSIEAGLILAIVAAGILGVFML
jgi:hypothetical protein